MDEKNLAVNQTQELQEVNKPPKPRLNYRMKRMLLYIQEHPFDDMDTVIKKLKVPPAEVDLFVRDYLSEPFQAYLNEIKNKTDELLEKASVDATFKIHELLSSDNENIRLKAGLGIIYARNKVKHPDRLVFQIKNIPQILNNVVLKERRND
jgi:hypothetical protein